MPSKNPKFNQSLADSFGSALKNWRERQGLSQQVIHNWGQATKTPLHNSQIAHLENGDLDPKAQFWVSLGKFHQALASKKLPATQQYFSKSDRDRLKAAEPYLDADGNVADAVCFFAQFIGAEIINETYTKPLGFTDENAKNATAFITKGFYNEVKRRKSTKVKAFLEMEPLLKKEGVPDRLIFKLKEVLVYEAEKFRKEDLNDLTKGKSCDCPIRGAFADWIGVEREKFPTVEEITNNGVGLLKNG